MVDILTRLEDKLEKRYDERKEHISRAHLVLSWDDYNFRAGYLEAIRDVGLMIKEVRNPELSAETGEIPSIVEEEKNNE